MFNLYSFSKSSTSLKLHLRCADCCRLSRTEVICDSRWRRKEVLLSCRQPCSPPTPWYSCKATAWCWSTSPCSSTPPLPTASGTASTHNIVSFNFFTEYFPNFGKEMWNNIGSRFHENFWRMKNNPTSKVSREMLMVALQHLQHILIRATDSVDFTRAT